jgi:hypothetical protein
MQSQDTPTRADGAGMAGALRAAHGRGDGVGGTLDTRGMLTILEARNRGVTDPEELRAAARAAKGGAR